MTVENTNEIFYETFIPGLVVIKTQLFIDDRGSLQEFFKSSIFSTFGHSFKPVHGALSCSLPRVIRGFHTEEWDKLILPITGEMFGAYVDSRPNSPTFGQVYTHVFHNKTNISYREAMIVPAGVGNSICVIGNKPVYYIYLNQEEWEAGKAKGIAWDDPDINVKWPIKNPVISERDMNNPRLRDIFPEKFK